jgi:hypothetical protein
MLLTTVHPVDPSDRSLAGMVVSKPTGGIDVSLWRVLCVVREMSLRRANHLSKGVLPSVVCPVDVIAKRRQ